ncbi:MAG: hypothetical protein ACRDJN_06760 [Chloroflexota bacterium]
MAPAATTRPLAPIPCGVPPPVPHLTSLLVVPYRGWLHPPRRVRSPAGGLPGTARNGPASDLLEARWLRRPTAPAAGLGAVLVVRVDATEHQADRDPSGAPPGSPAGPPVVLPQDGLVVRR